MEYQTRGSCCCHCRCDYEPLCGPPEPPKKIERNSDGTRVDPVVWTEELQKDFDNFHNKK